MERRKGRYYLVGNELAKMSGPRVTVYEALKENGFQFGMDYMAIETTLGTAELRLILGGPAGAPRSVMARGARSRPMAQCPPL